MKKEQVPLMTRIKGGLIGGFTTAIIMAGFDFADDQPFSTIKFILFFLVSAVVMALIIRPKTKN